MHILFCSVLNLYTENNHIACIAILDKKCLQHGKRKGEKYSVYETDVDTKVRLE